jgi:hypothetical protein
MSTFFRHTMLILTSEPLDSPRIIAGGLPRFIPSTSLRAGSEPRLHPHLKRWDFARSNGSKSFRSHGAWCGTPTFQLSLHRFVTSDWLINPSRRGPTGPEIGRCLMFTNTGRWNSGWSDLRGTRKIGRGNPRFLQVTPPNSRKHRRKRRET